MIRGKLGILKTPWSEWNQRGCGKYVQIREDDIFVFDNVREVGEPRVRIPFNESAGVTIKREARRDANIMKYMGAELHMTMTKNTKVFLVARQENGSVIVQSIHINKIRDLCSQKLIN